MYRVILFLSLLVGALAQSTVTGQCQTGIAFNLDLNQFSGIWYEHQRIQNSFETGSCAQQEWTNTSNTAGTLVVSEKRDGKWVNVDATFTFTQVTVDSQTGNRLDVRIENSDVNYYVVTTDYNNYALVYGCRNLNTVQAQVWGWKLSRNGTSINVAQIDAAIATVPQFAGITWLTTDRDDCSGGFAIVASPLLAVIALFLATKEHLFSSY